MASHQRAPLGGAAGTGDERARPSRASNGSSQMLDTYTNGYENGEAGYDGYEDDGAPLELDLATFSLSDFNVNRIVSSLTDPLITQSKQEGGGQ